MTILSKIELKKRVLIGEKLILKRIQINKHLNQKDIGKIEERLNKIFLGLMDDDETYWRDYSKELHLKPEILRERRSAIERCVNELFKDRRTNETKQKITEELSSDKNIEDLKGPEGKVLLPIFVDDIEYVCFRTANYDLRLGEDVYVTTEKVPKKLSAMGKDGVVSIEPGEFGILMTYEYIFVPPDLLGFISIRLSHKQKGLVNISGFHVDPGFYGRLMFAVFNAGPNDVPLRYKEPVFMIMFNKLTEDGLKFEKSRWSGMENIPVETLSGLRGTSVSVRSLDKRIRRLEIIFPILLTGIVSMIVGVIVWILAHL
jgi:dCTP deaminase